MGDRHSRLGIRPWLEVFLEPLLAFEFVYLAYTRWFGSRTVTSLPSVTLCTGVLKSQTQVEDALEQVRALGLRPHPGTPKNWDSLAAISLILHELGTDSRILDAGGTLYSMPTRWRSSAVSMRPNSVRTSPTRGVSALRRVLAGASKTQRWPRPFFKSPATRRITGARSTGICDSWVGSRPRWTTSPGCGLGSQRPSGTVDIFSGSCGLKNTGEPICWQLRSMTHGR